MSKENDDDAISFGEASKWEKREKEICINNNEQTTDEQKSDVIHGRSFIISLVVFMFRVGSNLIWPDLVGVI